MVDDNRASANVVPLSQAAGWKPTARGDAGTASPPCGAFTVSRWGSTSNAWVEPRGVGSDEPIAQLLWEPWNDGDIEATWRAIVEENEGIAVVAGLAPSLRGHGHVHLVISVTPALAAPQPCVILQVCTQCHADFCRTTMANGHFGLQALTPGETMLDLHEVTVMVDSDIWQAVLERADK